MNTSFDPCAPHLAHSRLGVARTAAAIAAADAATRLLSRLYVASNLAEPGERDDVVSGARMVASELCDYAALTPETPAYILRSIAQIHHGSPEYDRPIAEAIELVAQVANQRSAT